LLGIIWPSAELQKTQLIGIFDLYWIWDALRNATEEYTERPFLMDWELSGQDLIYCPFKNVDVSRFPALEPERE